MKKILVILILLMGSLTLYMALRSVVYLRSAVNVQHATDVYIPRNSSVSQACEIIGQSGMAESPSLFTALTTLYCWATSSVVHAGTYRFDSTTTHFQVMRALISGKQVLKVRVTFPEGIAAARFASILQRTAGTDSTRFLWWVHSDSLIRSCGIEARSLEGYLMPETYDVYWREPERVLVERLVRQQTKLWREKFESEAQRQSMSRHETLTLASIVEAETPLPQERSRVAGVYLNRLKRGMRLEADPTIQYALGGVQRRLYHSDLEVLSEYNTYLHNGLPPGPINSPSSASIDAVLHPESHNFLYFCAKGDGSNAHSFAASGAEHLRNVQRYRMMKRRANHAQ